MAFTIGEAILMPTSAEGVYLLPYTWFKYGVAVGALTINSPKFWDTIQGSMVAHLDQIVREHKKLMVYDWFCYTGKGVICPCKMGMPLKVNGETIYSYVDSSEHLKIPISHASWYGQYICGTIFEKKTVSQSLIQLFSGCHVTLEYSVWEVSFSNYQDVIFRAIMAEA